MDPKADKASSTLQIRDAVVAWIREDLRHHDPLEDDADLIASGVLDSLNLLRLVSFLEKKFKIKVNDEDLAPQNFRSLHAISEYVTRNHGG